jgi:hypothetical protein
MESNKNDWKLGEIATLPRKEKELKKSFMNLYVRYIGSRYICIREASDGQRGILLKVLGKSFPDQMKLVNGEPFGMDKREEIFNGTCYYSYPFPSVSELKEVLDILRRRYVRLTPEEWVRQQLLHRLVDQLGFPASLSAQEQTITVGTTKKRCDAVVDDRQMLLLMLIECKAETVPLTQKTLDQAIVYNRKLNVPYLLLCNGAQTIFVNGNDIYPSGLPRYADLLRRE